jgi:hypothetical protein
VADIIFTEEYKKNTNYRNIKIKKYKLRNNSRKGVTKDTPAVDYQNETNQNLKAKHPQKKKCVLL